MRHHGLLKPVSQMSYAEKRLAIYRPHIIILSKIRGDDMPIYILVSKLTNEGRKTIKNHPERIREVDQEIEKMGAKVLAQYATLGKYDFINIV
ncbi:MAG: hypothetical protein H6Q52_1744, partial [Deltaproteobacteria bacterium]|nr:hypothetical protein [Deltaproteobacteria bacterium]